MAKFSKWNQPKRRGGGRPLDPNSKAGRKRAEQARKEQEREALAFAEFENAEGGSYNGFSFANAFHAAYSNADALEVLFKCRTNAEPFGKNNNRPRPRVHLFGLCVIVLNR